jgi:hypothetical protein
MCLVGSKLDSNSAMVEFNLRFKRPGAETNLQTLKMELAGDEQKGSWCTQLEKPTFFVSPLLWGTLNLFWPLRYLDI